MPHTDQDGPKMKWLLTVAEVVVPHRTAYQFFVYFCTARVPIFANEFAQAYPNVILDALGAWRAAQYGQLQVETPTPEYVSGIPREVAATITNEHGDPKNPLGKMHASVNLQTEDDLRNLLPNVKGFVRICVRGPCRAVVAWLQRDDGGSGDQDALAGGLMFVPTFSSTLCTWRHDIVMANGYTFDEGTSPMASLSSCLRWDLVARYMSFPDFFEQARLLRYNQRAPPLKNLHFRTRKPDVRQSHTWRGVNGCVARDLTCQRLVDFIEIKLNTFPLVCGCFVRSPVSREAHVPLNIMPQWSRQSGVLFLDGDGYVKMVCNLGEPDEREFIIDTQHREEFNGALWVCARLAND